MKTGSLINNVKYTKEIVLFKIRIVIKRNGGKAVQLSPDLVIRGDGFWR